MGSGERETRLQEVIEIGGEGERGEHKGEDREKRGHGRREKGENGGIQNRDESQACSVGYSL